MSGAPVYFPKILLVGGSGSGKTYSLQTLLKANFEVLGIFTEPGMETLSAIPCSAGMHWRYINPIAMSFASLGDMVKKVNIMPYKALCEMNDPDRQKYTELQRLTDTMANYTCERCGKNFGAVDKLDPERFAVFNDSLSGISLMAMNTVVGGRPAKGQNEWGLAMDLIEKYVNILTTAVPCTTILVSHMEREVDEITGGSAVTVSTLGRKLAPKLPRFFSDTVHAKREGNKFTWSTITFNMDLKARNFPFSDNLEPDFSQAIKNFRARLVAGTAVAVQAVG